MRNRIVISAIVIGVFFALITFANAKADVYVKVDANGIAIDGPIMCDADTCGAGSEFSRLTLKEGEQYVRQNSGSAGIGSNNPNIEVKVDIATNDWTVTNTQTEQVIQTFNSNVSAPVIDPFIIETNTAVVETNTATAIDTLTASVQLQASQLETLTASVNASTEVKDLWADIRKLLNYLLLLITALASK